MRVSISPAVEIPDWGFGLRGTEVVIALVKVREPEREEGAPHAQHTLPARHVPTCIREWQRWAAASRLGPLRRAAISGHGQAPWPAPLVPKSGLEIHDLRIPALK
jgi:hypothetical protein